MPDGGVHIRFIDGTPPPARTGRGGVPHAEYAAILRAHPGQWAILPGLSVLYTSQITAGTLRAYRIEEGGYESVSRDGVLYARYVP